MQKVQGLIPRVDEKCAIYFNSKSAEQFNKLFNIGIYSSHITKRNRWSRKLMNDKFAINKTRIGNLSSLLVWFSNHLNLPKDFTTYYILPKILNSLSYVHDVPRYIFATCNKVTHTRTRCGISFFTFNFFPLFFRTNDEVSLNLVCLSVCTTDNSRAQTDSPI